MIPVSAVGPVDLGVKTNVVLGRLGVSGAVTAAGHTMGVNANGEEDPY